MKTAKPLSNETMMLIPITAKELEANFDNYIDRVQDGEVFLIDDRVVLTKADLLEELHKDV